MTGRKGSPSGSCWSFEIKVITSSRKPSTPISSQNRMTDLTSSRTFGLSISIDMGIILSTCKLLAVSFWNFIRGILCFPVLFPKSGLTHIIQGRPLFCWEKRAISATLLIFTPPLVVELEFIFRLSETLECVYTHSSLIFCMSLSIISIVSRTTKSLNVPLFS